MAEVGAMKALAIPAEGCSVPTIFGVRLKPLETEDQKLACRIHDRLYKRGGTEEDRLMADLEFALDLLGWGMSAADVMDYFLAVHVFGGPEFRIPGVSWAFGGGRFCYGEKATST